MPLLKKVIPTLIKYRFMLGLTFVTISCFFWSSQHLRGEWQVRSKRSAFIAMPLNEMITNVSRSKETSIKVGNVKDWINVNIFKYDLSKSMGKLPYFEEGDSIIKATNSGKFTLVKDSSKYDYFVK